MNHKKRTVYLTGVSLVVCLCLVACKKNSTSESNPPTSPRITSFAPASARGGTSIVITGANFSTSTNGNTVTINGHAATVTAVNSSGTQLTATVPLRAGSGPVTVTVNNRTATSASSLTYEWAYTSVTILAGSNVGSGGFADDNNGANVRFDKPAGIAVDTAGNLYVADAYNHRIRKVSPTGATTTLAGTGVRGFADGTSGAAVKFDYPYGVTVDRNGNIYVADASNNRIRKVAPTGATTTLAGNGNSGWVDHTDPIQVKFYYPYGVAVDAIGSVYVTDQGNHRIRKVTSTGTTTTLAGNGNTGWVDHTDPSQVKFNYPYGVALDAGGNVYIADANNHRIRKVSPAGATTTWTGNGIAGYEDNTNGLNAKFRYPTGITIGLNGDIYVADQDNHRIRKITATGAVSTVAGNGTAGLLNDATNPLAAQFSTPYGVAIDKEGNLYVTDRGNNCIRKITIQ